VVQLNRPTSNIVGTTMIAVPTISTRSARLMERNRLAWGFALANSKRKTPDLDARSAIVP